MGHGPSYDTKALTVRVPPSLTAVRAGPRPHAKIPKSLHRLGRELYEAAPSPKTLWTVPGGDHNDLRETAGPEYRERLRRFYETLPIPAAGSQP